MGFGGSGGSGGGAISSATDVALSNPANNEVLQYNGTTGKWSNGTAAGGASNIRIIKYAAGAYPALPGTKPTGVDLFIFKGPVQPTGMPSYIGDGPSQIMADYEYRAL